MEMESLISSENIKQEPDYEGQTVKKEIHVDETSDMYSDIKRTTASFTSRFSPDEDSFQYCDKCHLKYEGACPERGPLIYIDSAETGNGEGCSQDSSPKILGPDSKDMLVQRRENMLQSRVCEARIDDVRTLSNGDCSTESDQMSSICEMNTELRVAGTSCGFKSNVEIKTRQKIHNIGKPFTCDVCGTEFAYWNQLKRHMRLYTGEKPYKCDVCGVGFAESGTLKSHKRTHTGEKPYKCDLCGLGFTQCNSLKIHKRTHTGEKPYICDVCGVGFTENGNLKSHKRTHTGEKPYKCDLCGVGFVQCNSLKIHKRAHTGEKPYKCDLCGVGCAKNSDLTRHMRTHTGEKPYKCDVCGVGFSQSNNLKTHKRIHVGEEPYKCEVFDVGFNEHRTSGAVVKMAAVFSLQ